jgi:hypothetical protein
MTICLYHATGYPAVASDDGKIHRPVYSSIPIDALNREAVELHDL